MGDEVRYRANLGDRETAEWFARRPDFVGNAVVVELLDGGWVEFDSDCLTWLRSYTENQDCSVTNDGLTSDVTMSIWIGGDAYPVYEVPPGDEVVIWSVVRGDSRFSQAVEPVMADVEIPGDILTWAEGHGLHEDDPDVYVLVTPADEAGEVTGGIAYIQRPATAGEVRRIRAALDELSSSRNAA